MRFTAIDPPRVFEVGSGEKIRLKDCARIDLAPDEQVTFVTDSGAEYDVARKIWGFYATPSLNGRLERMGLRAVLVKSPGSKFYVFLVQHGMEPEFRRYLEIEKHVIVCWLDNSSQLEKLEQKLALGPGPLLCLCGSKDFRVTFTYHAPPEGEIRFECVTRGSYFREVWTCNVCGHFRSVHDMDTSKLYSGDYVSSNYGDSQGILRTFQRIISLDPAQSDNVGRVRRVLEFADSHFRPQHLSKPLSVLDVGSGLCVFPYKMKEAGWECTAVDPDIRAVEHARDYVGVRGVHGDFMNLRDIGRYHLVSFNKVLEHIPDPVAMLEKSLAHLRPCGFAYVEVPDGEAACADGPGREEFFIDHLHVFSAASLALLSARAGFSVQMLERLREPSGKYTLRAFLKPQASVEQRTE